MSDIDVNLRDKTESNYLKILPDGRALVSQVLDSPEGSTRVSVLQQGPVSGTVDFFYTIPSGQTFTVQRLSAGGQGGKQSVIEFFHAPAGNTTGLVLIEAGYVDGNSVQFQTEQKFTGDGVRAILIRRRRLDGASVELYGRMEGYLL